MRKKTSKQQEVALVSDVVEQAVSHISCQRAQRQARLAMPSAAEIGRSQLKETTQQAAAEPKKRKMVEFKVLASIMEFATEKAQLLSFHTEAEVEVKFWLSKSLSHFVADGDEPEKMICRVPAWLYYKAGLNNYFPITRWSQAAI